MSDNLSFPGRRTQGLREIYRLFWADRTTYEDACKLFISVGKEIEEWLKWLDSAELIEDKPFIDECKSEISVLYKRQYNFLSIMVITKMRLVDTEVRLLSRGYTQSELGSIDWIYCPMYSLQLDLVSYSLSYSHYCQ